MQTHLEPLAEAAEGESVAGDRDLVERIVREQTGQVPRELRFLRTDDGLLAYLTLVARPRHLAGRRSLARQRDRGADPQRAARDQRRDRPHRAMKLCMFTPLEHEIRGWPGRIEGDRVIQLAAQTLESFFTGGGKAREHAEYPLDEVRLLAPVQRPPSVRDFYAFEEHVRNARAVTGRGEVVPEWYEIPVFYFSNPAAIYGPDDEIPYPEGSEALDYELEVAAVIGAEGRIGGFTVMNDWSARDLQRQEMKVGLGPAKGKDFATSLGPVLVTPDELGDLRLEMVARVNGEERSRGNLGDIYHSWESILARPRGATRQLRPGDVLGSGTVGTGCILEHGDERWLQPGDEVELEVEGIGVWEPVGPRRTVRCLTPGLRMNRLHAGCGSRHAFVCVSGTGVVPAAAE